MTNIFLTNSNQLNSSQNNLAIQSTYSNGVNGTWTIDQNGQLTYVPFTYTTTSVGTLLGTQSVINYPLFDFSKMINLEECMVEGKLDIGKLLKSYLEKNNELMEKFKKGEISIDEILSIVFKQALNIGWVASKMEISK